MRRLGHPQGAAPRPAVRLPPGHGEEPLRDLGRAPRLLPPLRRTPWDGWSCSCSAIGTRRCPALGRASAPASSSRTTGRTWRWTCARTGSTSRGSCWRRHGVKEWDLNAGTRRRAASGPSWASWWPAPARSSRTGGRSATAWAATCASRCASPGSGARGSSTASRPWATTSSAGARGTAPWASRPVWPGGPGDGAVSESKAARLTRQSGTSFYYAFRLLPADKRRAIYALYSFCRVVDDCVDEPGGEGEAGLAGWLEEARPLLRRASPDRARPRAGRARARVPHPAALVRGHRGGVPDGPHAEVRYPTFAAASGLLRAGGLGGGPRLHRDLRLSQARARATTRSLLGVALQLTNIVRDVAEDAAPGPHLPAPGRAAALRGGRGGGAGRRPARLPPEPCPDRPAGLPGGAGARALRAGPRRCFRTRTGEPCSRPRSWAAVYRALLEEMAAAGLAAGPSRGAPLAAAQGLDRSAHGAARVLEPVRVVVVGGGFAGLAAAIALQERRHEVTLLERTGRAGRARDVVPRRPDRRGRRQRHPPHDRGLPRRPSTSCAGRERRTCFWSRRTCASTTWTTAAPPPSIVRGCPRPFTCSRVSSGCASPGACASTPCASGWPCAFGPSRRGSPWPSTLRGTRPDGGDAATAVGSAGHRDPQRDSRAGGRGTLLERVSRGLPAHEPCLAPRVPAPRLGSAARAAGRAISRPEAEPCVAAPWPRPSSFTMTPSAACGTCSGRRPARTSAAGAAPRPPFAAADVVVAAVPWHAVPGLLPEALALARPLRGLGGPRRLAHRVHRAMARPGRGRSADGRPARQRDGVGLRQGPALRAHRSAPAPGLHRERGRSQSPRPNAELAAAAEAALRRYFPAMSERHGHPRAGPARGAGHVLVPPRGRGTAAWTEKTPDPRARPGRRLDEHGPARDHRRRREQRPSGRRPRG